MFVVPYSNAPPLRVPFSIYLYTSTYIHGPSDHFIVLYLLVLHGTNSRCVYMSIVHLYTDRPRRLQRSIHKVLRGFTTNRCT